jgi:hypothetical protein
MATILTSRALIAVFALSTMGVAQTSAPPPAPDAPCPSQSQTPSDKPCTPPASTSKPPAEQFPFPGEPAKPATPPNAPATNPASVAHPFPTAPPPKLPGDDSSSSSSSDDHNSSSDVDPTPDPAPGTEGTSTHRKLPKVQRVQTDDERVDEDLNVAKFYMGDENFQGAYLRSKDAVKVQPDYAATHFALAVAAQKLKKNEEAVVEYNAYLKLAPDGEKSRAAHEALDKLK